MQLGEWEGRKKDLKSSHKYKEKKGNFWKGEKEKFMENSFLGCKTSARCDREAVDIAEGNGAVNR